MKLLPQALAVAAAASAIGFVAFLLMTGASSTEPASQLPPPQMITAVRLTDTFTNGRHLVFGEIKPGIYRTNGSTVVDYPICTWKLYDGGHLVAAGSASGAVSIVIDPTHDEVESDNCKPWRRLR